MNPAEYIDFDAETNTLHIKGAEGIQYRINGRPVNGDIKLTKNTTVRAHPRGRLFDEGAETEWRFEVSDISSEEVDEIEATEEEDTQPNEVEDTPPGPTAGNTPESPEQQAKTGGLSFGRPNIP